MKKIIIFKWIVSIFCMTAFVNGFNLGSIILFALGVVTLPPLKIQIHKNKGIRYLIYVVMFIVGIILLPTNNSTI